MDRNPPSARRPRIDAWPAAMRAVLMRHQAGPFVWGQSDCALFADAVAAMTGYDPLADCRGYTSEFGALKKLKAAGFDNVDELVAARFVEIAPVAAQRGDLGYPARIARPLMGPAVIDGAHAFSKGPEGFVVVPRSVIVRAFAV